LKTKDTEKDLLETTLREKFSTELRTKDDIIKMKDEEIELRKDMKTRLSTKMLGETLEEHCGNEFNKLRATAFQMHTLKKIMTQNQEARGIIFIVNLIVRVTKLYL
jgi:hypothetical protein